MAPTISAPAVSPAPGQPIGSRPGAGQHRAGRGGPLSRLARSRTPQKLQALLVVLVILSLAWGALGAWTVGTHASAANSLAHADEPYSRDAQELYLAIADADVTITTSLLTQAEPQPPSTLAARQHFEADLASASRYLADLTNSGGNAQLTAEIAAIGQGLSDYKGDVAIAETEFAQGVIPTGDSAMEVASEDVHLQLLPNAKLVYAQEIAAVNASKSEATSLPTILLVGLIAIAALLVLLWSQRWLAGRTRRVLNVWLVLATAALVISGGWMMGAFAAASSDLGTAIGQGANPAQELAQASIDVGQIRGDSILNVIARSGTTSLQTDSTDQAANVTSLLDTASKAGNGPVTADLAPAMAAEQPWYQANLAIYKLGSDHDYNAELTSVMNASGPSLTGYDKITSSLNSALGAARDTFTSQADAGASAFGWLEAAVIFASLAMAISSAYGLSRRLSEYR